MENKVWICISGLKKGFNGFCSKFDIFIIGFLKIQKNSSDRSGFGIHEYPYF